MFAKSVAKVALLSVPLMLGVSPAFASPAPAGDVRMPSFRSLEYRYGDADAVDAARQEIGARIPAGTSVEDARRLLRYAGARCETRGDAMRCRYNVARFADDVMQDVAWTIDVASSDGRVSAITIDRQ